MQKEDGLQVFAAEIVDCQGRSAALKLAGLRMLSRPEAACEGVILARFGFGFFALAATWRGFCVTSSVVDDSLSSDVAEAGPVPFKCTVSMPSAEFW